MESRLKLPLAELKTLYIKHLILKELLMDDLSLYILSICFINSFKSPPLHNSVIIATSLSVFITSMN